MIFVSTGKIWLGSRSPSSCGPNELRNVATESPLSDPFVTVSVSQHSHDSPIFAFGSPCLPYVFTSSLPPQIAGANLGSSTYGYNVASLIWMPSFAVARLRPRLAGWLL